MGKEECVRAVDDQSVLPEGEQEIYRQILKVLQNYTGVDFLLYKENTLVRRIRRRMGLNHLESMGQYRDFLIMSDEEKAKLYEDIFISVTEFFRDPEAFQALYDKVLPGILENGREARIWCAACCTGEEAYSLAILAEEYKRRHQSNVDVKIFATDINQESVTFAQAGLYPKDRLNRFTQEDRERCFVKEGAKYRISPQIRKYVIFARHNLLQDPPFYQMDLIACRNMFIYLKPDAQKSLQNLFYRQLKEGGCLFLGGSESAVQFDNSFQAVDAGCRIYRKNSNAKKTEQETGGISRGTESAVLHQVRQERGAVENTPPAEAVCGDEPESRIRMLEESLQESREQLQRTVEELQKKNELLQYSNKEMSISNEELQSINEEVHSVNEELQTVNWEYQNKIEELIKANADFDNLLQNAQVGALYIDHDLCIRKLTPMIEQMTNLIAADVGRPVSHVSFMKEYSDLEEDVRISLENETVIEREVHDRKGRIWLVRIRPYYDAMGQRDGALVTLYDITKRLEAAKYELKLLNDNLPGGVAKMRFDRGLILEYANQGLYKLTKCTKKEFEQRFGNHYDYIVLPQDWAVMKHKIRNSIRSCKPFRMEYRVRSAEGGEEWRLMHAVPLEKGNPILQCIISDITKLKQTQLQLDSLIDNIPGGILRLHYDGTNIRVDYVSDKLIQLFGYEKEIFFKTLEELQQEDLFFFEQDKKRIREALDATLHYGKEQESEYALRRQNGEKIWVELRGSIVSRTQTGVTVQYTVIDVSRLVKVKEQARQEKERLDVIVSLTADLIFEYDIQTDTMFYFNQKKDIANLVPVVEHYTEEIMHGDLILAQDREELQEFCARLREGRRNINAELRKRYGDGRYHWIAVKARGICNDKGVPVRVVGKTIIIDERKELEESLRKRSERDSMTGLYNASTVKMKIEEKLAGVPESESRYLVVIDVDEFKRINDTMGHLFGDAVIVTFADALEQGFPGGISGRIGGDEFILFLQGLPFEEIIRKMNLLNAQLRKAYSGGQEKVTVSCSAGIAPCVPGLTYEQLVRRADSALYYVKKSQKGTIRLYEDFMHIVGDVLNDEKKPIAPYTREVMIRTDDDLVLFALEMFEKVPDIKSVIRAISDRMCRYYGIRDILYLRPVENDRMHLTYHWGEGENVQFVSREFPVEEPEWQKLLYGHSQEGFSILQEKDIVTRSESHAKSMLSVRLDENGVQGYMLFADWQRERDWKEEKNGLKRLSYILFRRLGQLELLQKEMEETNYIISHDSKTDLLNYTSFLMNAEQYIRENPGRKFYLVYSDFSNFQYLNETYGYAAGDDVLKEFGSVLKEQCRYGILFARVTADHFISLHEGVGMEKLREEYTGICRDFCERIDERYELCKIVLVSGICEVDRTQDIFAVNIDNANLARKAVKNKTQTLCIPYTEHMRQQSQIQMEISANMESGLERGEFVAFLQPKIELATGRLAGAEALVRWMKPNGTMMCPDQFIPIFEKNGFITKIDFEVLRQVLEIQRGALERGQKPLRISVNFSRQHQENPHLVSQIQEMLEKYQVPGSYLEVEITESVFMYDLEPLNENIGRLKKAGASVSIDDFGSGYSSLNVLSKVQADIIKLDRQFLLDMENGNTEKPAEFLKMLIDMIKQLGFRVIAEGVETLDQVKLLQDAGCEFAQGYYYATPMPCKEFMEFAYNYVKIHGMV